MDLEKIIESKNSVLCPIKYCFNIAGGKWKLEILCILAGGKPKRYSKIKRILGNITNAVLSQSLQQLESDGLINRIQYNEVPPRVEYSLTEKGDSFVNILIELAEWGNKHMMDEDNIESYCRECLSEK